jgi:hypothetical protein
VPEVMKPTADTPVLSQFVPAPRNVYGVLVGCSLIWLLEF